MAREAIEMNLASADRDEWEHEKKIFAAEILARLRDSGLFDAEGLTSSKTLPLAAPHTYKQTGFHRENTHHWPSRRKRILVTAASLLLMFTLPVLALAVVQNLLKIPTRPESHPEFHEERATAISQIHQPARRRGSDAQPFEPATPNASGVLDPEPIVSEALDGFTEAKLREFELVALLPNTEEEFKAWARREYPHVIGLYDLLTRVDENDSRYGPLWDGIPAHTPEWAERLYDNVAEIERPTGWRALLIYSGEVLKFDWPTGVDELNCEPTAGALQQAAAVAGFALVTHEYGDYDMPEAPYVDAAGGWRRFNLIRAEAIANEWAVPARNVPEEYVATVMGNMPLARAALVYLVTSSKLVQMPPFDNLAQEAELLLHDFFNSRTPECNVRTHRMRFERLLERRRELIEGFKAV